MASPTSTWNLPPPPGFQGLRDDLPVTVYEQHLPHWRQDGATYFATFRLNDSLPQSKLRELRAFKADWELRHPKPRSHRDLDEFARESMRRIETWLDQGMGGCLLKDKEIAAIIAEILEAHDDQLAELGCFVVMPNHVHLIVRPLNPTVQPIETFLKNVKGGSAHKINEKASRSGALWQRESFDRIIRDVEHLYRVIQYIGRNAAKAGLSIADVPRWIRPSWAQCGWDFEP